MAAVLNCHPASALQRRPIFSIVWHDVPGHDWRVGSRLAQQTVDARKSRGLCGLDSSVVHRQEGGPDVDSGAGFREFVERNIEAEALGYVSTFLVEHHFTGFGQVSASLNLLTWIGARTTTLRLGTAVLVLPWHNPVLLAEQVATLDLLSGGGSISASVKGTGTTNSPGSVSPWRRRMPFDECVEVMTRAWISDAPWSHRGKYWQFEDVAVEPPTAQKPHPPLWMGAGESRFHQKWRRWATICCWASLTLSKRSARRLPCSRRRWRPWSHL